MNNGTCVTLPRLLPRFQSTRGKCAMANKASWSTFKKRGLLNVEATAGPSPVVSEQELYRRIQAVLPKQTDSQQPLACLNKGVLRWTLHKNVQNNPANSLSMLWVLIKELEKAERWGNRKHIIPLLHTLMYAIIQTAYIPDELYKRVYDSCKRLLTFPHPYCSLGLSYSRQIKTERLIPGLMYQRMVTAEQRLKNVHYPFQERVFVLADPEVFSGPLAQVLSADIESSISATSEAQSPSDHMRSIIQHSLQAALGEQCDGPELALTLKDMEAERFFQEVLAALEHSVEEGCGGGKGGALRSTLQRLYAEIVGPSADPASDGHLHDCPLPNPEMSFHLWTEDMDIWRELSKCLRSNSMGEQFSDIPEDFELEESPGDMMESDKTRLSVMSNDSGIERDLPPGADPSTAPEMANLSIQGEPSKGEQDSSRLSRRGCIRVRPSVRDSMALMQDSLDGDASLGGGGRGGLGGSGGSKLQRRVGSSTVQNTFPKQQRNFTAKIVAMGDDRVMGRLARAYYFFRKREARRVFLTMKVNLQFYYIPVSSAQASFAHNNDHVYHPMRNPCSLGSYLSMVDPWYNCNVTSLGYDIHKLAQLQKVNQGRPKEPFVSDVISYYVRIGQQPIYFNIYFVKIMFTSLTMEAVEDVFVTHLEMDFPGLRQISASVKEKTKRNAGEACGALIFLNYKKVTLSGRDIEIQKVIKTTGAQISAIPTKEEEDLNCLTLEMNDSPAKTKNSTTQKIRTSNVNIHTMDKRSFTVRLDRDSRRTYTDVNSIEISPCVDPGYCVQKTVRSKLHPGEEANAGLCKYMSKGLPLPVNTFGGITN